ncbi:uncharacterized protein DS421_15g506830 [Arachis hypogaea]|nr:uncharacterized protein DS421_15g506830 [Arachis hypogaea]
MRRKGKEPVSSSAPAPVHPSTQPDTFITEEAQEKYKNLEKKTFHYEWKLNVPEKYEEAIHNRLDYYQWKFIESDPGVQLDTFTHALEALLQLPHIPPSRDAYLKIVADLSQGKKSLDAVLKRIGLPEARWEYSRGENAVSSSIACSHLHPEARIWQQIIVNYILSSMHAMYIRVRVAVLLWAILEDKRISVLPLIRESMWKVNQQKKYNIPFPSMITRLATLSGIDRRPGDRMSTFINTQPFLPYEEYKGPPQKKKKTTEPASSSAPSTPSAPAPAPPTTYELVQDILQELRCQGHRSEHRFQWIMARHNGRDPGPPPVHTPQPDPEPEPETKTEQPPHELAVEAAVERAEEAAVKDLAVEATAEIIVELTTDIIVYQPPQHLPLPDGGTSQSYLHSFSASQFSFIEQASLSCFQVPTPHSVTVTPSYGSSHRRRATAEPSRTEK